MAIAHPLLQPPPLLVFSHECAGTAEDLTKATKKATPISVVTAVRFKPKKDRMFRNADVFGGGEVWSEEEDEPGSTLEKFAAQTFC